MLSIIGILVIGFFAGAIAPQQRWSIMLNMIGAGAGFLIFEDQAVTNYVAGHVWFSISNQILAGIFFAAFYYGVKSTRGTFAKPEATAADDFAMEILKDRYARGELTTQEFEERREELDGR